MLSCRNTALSDHLDVEPDIFAKLIGMGRITQDTRNNEGNDKED